MNTMTGDQDLDRDNRQQTWWSQVSAQVRSLTVYVDLDVRVMQVDIDEGVLVQGISICWWSAVWWWLTECRWGPEGMLGSVVQTGYRVGDW